MIIMNEYVVSLIIVDTSSFEKEQFDFISAKSASVVSLFELLKSKDIKLLVHPVLDREIRKHIKDSGVFKSVEKLKNILSQMKNFMIKNRYCDNKLIENLNNTNVDNLLSEAYSKYYSDAIILDYPDPKIIFSQYFNNIAPFSKEKNKKSEFPDAFIIQSVKDYLSLNPNERLLVVSGDNDWKAAFKDNNKVIWKESIVDALTFLNSVDSILSTKKIEKIFESVKSDLEESINDIFYDCPCQVNGFDEWEDTIINTAKLKNIISDIKPLKVTRDKLILRVGISLSVTGSGKKFQSDYSAWDDEDKRYLFKSYNDISFDNGILDTDIEVDIDYDFNAPESTAEISDIKIIDNSWLLVDEVTEVSVIETSRF